MANTFTLHELQSETQTGKAFDFPIDAFPGEMQQIIRDTNEFLGYPVDFTGTSMLFAVGLAVGNTHKVQLKPGWEENGTVLMALVGRPGTCKSHPITFALRPFINRDQISLREYENRKLEYDEQMALPKDERNFPNPVKPIWQKHLMQDFTPESLIEVLRFNRRGLGVYQDELMGFFKNFGRYNNGGSDQEFWLSAWSGSPILQDRKSGEPVLITQPYLSLIGTIQEGILKSLGSNNRNQNGFLDRILFAFPPDLKKDYWNEAEISIRVSENWNRFLTNLLEHRLQLDEDQNPQPNILKYTPEAYALMREWQQYNTDLINTAPVESLGSLYVKLETYCVRLSLILQMAAYATSEADRYAVELLAVVGAIKLIEYFRETGTRVHDQIHQCSNPLESLPENKRLLYEALPEEFLTKEGEKIAAEYQISRRTFHYFLGEPTLFKRLSRGKIQKII